MTPLTINPSNRVPVSVGIVGAGIMGRVLAWRLASAGYLVSLFDRDPIEHGRAAAYTAAGMLTPYAEIESAELMIYQLGMKSLKLWPEIVDSLTIPVAFYQQGSLVVSHRNDRSELQRFNQQLAFKLKNDPNKNLTHQFVDQTQLSEIEAELATRFCEATYLPEEAWISTEDVMRALAVDILGSGVKWYQQTIVEHLRDNQVSANGLHYEFDRVIDTRGLGAKPDMRRLRGVRGELIELEAPEVNIRRLVRLMHPRYRLYLVPMYQNDRYLIGATQIESDDAGPITVRSTLELLSAAYSLHPGFAEAKVIQTKTNCRPALANNLPVIECKDRLIRINGLFRHGFLLAPALAEEVLNLLQTSGDYQSNYCGLLHHLNAEVCEYD